MSHSAANRVIDTFAPLLALVPVRRRPVAIDASTRLVTPSVTHNSTNRNDTIVYRGFGTPRIWSGGQYWPTVATAATPR